MHIDWEAVQKALSPAKNYEDVLHRLRDSFSYRFVSERYNFDLPELITYTQRLLGGDARKRYDDYATGLTRILSELSKSGIYNIEEMLEQTATRQQLEQVVNSTRISALEMVSVLKYLLYWVIPGEKYLSGLVRNEPVIQGAIMMLGASGLRTNLQLIQNGLTVRARETIAQRHELPYAVITDLVNRADFSRLPWASKATISNIIGAGYRSLAELANADPEKLYADFFLYGKKIGKNLKLGNEIENSYRVAKIIPAILES